MVATFRFGSVVNMKFRALRWDYHAEALLVERGMNECSSLRHESRQTCQDEDLIESVANGNDTNSNDVENTQFLQNDDCEEDVAGAAEAAMLARVVSTRESGHFWSTLLPCVLTSYYATNSLQRLTSKA